MRNSGFTMFLGLQEAFLRPCHRIYPSFLIRVLDKWTKEMWWIDFDKRIMHKILVARKHKCEIDKIYRLITRQRPVCSGISLKRGS